jgi:hypothetical protein
MSQRYLPSNLGILSSWRRGRPDGSWRDVGTALTSEITLESQERGRKWEYRVIAMNKAGASEPSNTVMAVL